MPYYFTSLCESVDRQSLSYSNVEFIEFPKYGPQLADKCYIAALFEFLLCPLYQF